MTITEISAGRKLASTDPRRREELVSDSCFVAGLYAKLLRGYALDALERPVDKALALSAFPTS